MLKTIVATALLISLGGCGGSSDSVNPFVPEQQQDQPQTDANTLAAADDGLITNDDGTVINSALGSGAGAGDFIRGDCVDTDPVGDGFGWDGVDTCIIEAQQAPEPTPQPVPEPTPEPITATQIEAPAGFGDSGVLGTWYCASILDDSVFRTNWNNYWQIQFIQDQTVVLRDGSNAVSTWDYTTDGVSIQWSHNGQFTSYVLNARNVGGMMDSGSHCLRELPPTEAPPPGAQDTADAELQRSSWDCVRRFPNGGGNYQLHLAMDHTYSYRNVYNGQPDTWSLTGEWSVQPDGKTVHLDYIGAGLDEFTYSSVNKTLNAPTGDIMGEFCDLSQ